MAAEIEDGIVIAQVQGIREVLKFPEPLTDFRWIGFVGFGVSLVDLVENGSNRMETEVNEKREVTYAYRC